MHPVNLLQSNYITLFKPQSAEYCQVEWSIKIQLEEVKLLYKI